MENLDEIKNEEIPGGLQNVPPDCGLDPDFRCDIKGVKLVGRETYGIIDGCYNGCPYQDVINRELYCTNYARIAVWLETGE